MKLKTVALACAVLLAACSPDPATAPTVAVPHRASLLTGTILDSAPPAPTPVSAAVVGSDTTNFGFPRLLVEVKFVDNTTATDEWATCARFTKADGSPVTTQCVYASAYDSPAGSTGERTATVVSTAADSVDFYTTRGIAFSDPLVGAYTLWVKSAKSVKIGVASAVSVSTSGTKRKGKP